MARFKDVYLKDDGVYRKVNEEEIKISKPMGIESRQINIDTGEQLSKIWQENNNKRYYRDMKRDDYLNTNNIIGNQKYGFDILQETSKYLVRHFSNEEESSKVELVHSELGFGKYDGNMIFKHHKAIGVDSTYCGRFLVEPKGDKKEVEKLIRNHISNHPPAVMMMLFSLVSVLIGYLSDVLEMEPIIMHAVGNSTTGKSTLCKFAISLFGYPGVKDNGLFFTYNATDNALYKRLVGLNGIPAALDELSMSDNKNDFVYKLNSGKDKDRLNQDSELKDSRGWLGSILSNGERSLTSTSSKNAGILVRIFEAENIKWTKSAEHSEIINSVCLKNYGHTGVEFAEYVMTQDKEKLTGELTKKIDYLMKVIGKRVVEDDFIKRRVNKYALVYLTGKLYQEMSGIKLNLSEVIRLFIKMEKDSIKNRNFERSALEYINMYVDKNRNKFETNEITPKGEVLGRIIKKDKYVELEMNQLNFEQILKEGGYEDKNVVLNRFKINGILSCDKDRYTRKRKNNAGVKIPYIVLKLMN